MFNNINDNNKDLLFSQYKAGNVINLASVRSAYNNNGLSKNPYVDKTEISSNAMKLFQRDLDINKFTKIATSDKEDLSYLSKMQELFKDGVVDPFEDDVIESLASNQKLLDDLK